MDCTHLASLLSKAPSDRENILVIDIRPSTSFATRHIKGSINICAPSTLLKRAGVTVDRVEDSMLQCDDDRRKFSAWRKGPTKDAQSNDQPSGSSSSDSEGVQRIVVIDTDTTSTGEAGRPAAGGGGPCLIGMLRKFEAAGYAGHLSWLVGGFAGFFTVASKNANHLLESGESASKETSEPLKMMQLGGLPMEAFTANSTTDRSNSQNPSSNHRPTVGDVGASNQNSSASCNPFFDNIRQNRELQHGITERIPLEVPADLTASQKALLPSFIRHVVENGEKEQAQQLAQNFFDVEKAEQSRLMATMRQHAAESGIDPRNQVFGAAAAEASPGSASSPGAGAGPTQLSSAYSRISGAPPSASMSASSFPFSICAALERGADNRYNNIWTYEHSRVRVPPIDTAASCEKESGGCGDYFNGSFMEPLKQYGVHRSYIATQAPLPSTFEKFWTAVWQQNARTIAMLTREYESGRVQSHDYWSQKSHGDQLEIQVLEETHLDGKGQPIEKEDGPVMIKRIIRLTNKAEPQSAPRQITHLQYVGWPDYSIPSDPEALLVYMDMASQRDWTREAAVGPLMLHCSAGVGRTGTYIVIDSVLDALRRERRRKAESASGSSGTSSSANLDTIDLIRHATDVAREQRMSSVQTQRQYVFCYLAVLHGVLREGRREGLEGA
ncbi:hypothetical protein BDZ90DRAFT_218306 [Jaminaea rosea]|uniref:protein-tyrosine-phosphatase n=1 Tax=Jaminaea rosea TaxID=1569628 RepID=A0A316V0U9_9BASI|nr:hypothetical protein BDZ90DRAFT_218306 [Jaminaea rosea]PWN29065.1 hypothetical protein BDZ90DRAFT_218306 [Jaminaea rosea]